MMRAQFDYVPDIHRTAASEYIGTPVFVGPEALPGLVVSIDWGRHDVADLLFTVAFAQGYTQQYQIADLTQIEPSDFSARYPDLAADLSGQYDGLLYAVCRRL
jgi:hypothetical protein